jgi:hypothetical protein
MGLRTKMLVYSAIVFLCLLGAFIYSQLTFYNIKAMNDVQKQSLRLLFHWNDLLLASQNIMLKDDPKTYIVEDYQEVIHTFETEFNRFDTMVTMTSLPEIGEKVKSLHGLWDYLKKIITGIETIARDEYNAIDFALFEFHPILSFSSMVRIEKMEANTLVIIRNLSSVIENLDMAKGNLEKILFGLPQEIDRKIHAI